MKAMRVITAWSQTTKEGEVVMTGQLDFNIKLEIGQNTFTGAIGRLKKERNFYKDVGKIMHIFIGDKPQVIKGTGVDNFVRELLEKGAYKYHEPGAGAALLGNQYPRRDLERLLKTNSREVQGQTQGPAQQFQ